MSESTVRIHYNRNELYDKFVQEWDLFNSYVDLFVFAASVGYATADESDVIEYTDAEFKGTGDNRGEMLWMHFAGKTTYCAVAASLAYQLFDDPEALGDPKLQLEALARFAKAGMDTLEQEFGDSVSTPRDGMLSFIANFEEHDATSADSDGNIMNRISGSFNDTPSEE